MWNTPAELHAAWNDLPLALLFFSVVFDLVGNATKRESLKAAGFWTLVVGAAAALLAMITGLRAEDSIEHGGTMHLVMERHENLGITVTVIFVSLAAWRIWRRGQLGVRERPAYLAAATMGALMLAWTGHLGGTMVFRHGGGIPSEVLRGAIEERATEHTHEAGEEHDDGAADPADSTGAADHSHPPGTPEHD